MPLESDGKKLKYSNLVPIIMHKSDDAEEEAVDADQDVSETKRK
jgi:hypothetical protein